MTRQGKPPRSTARANRMRGVVQRQSIRFITKGALTSDETSSNESPTVVLVHGAFADASSWNGVIERLQARGVNVVAPANPLRGIASDSAYISTVLEQIAAPVIAVAHSYGGAVITNAATGAK